MSTPPSQVTALLEAHSSGDQSALDQLLPLIYDELRGLARVAFARQGPNHTLQPTALAHEAWLKLAGGLDEVRGKRHFFAIAGRAMSQVLTDHARALAQAKREGRRHAVSLQGVDTGALDQDYDLIALEDSLRRLGELNPRHARIVELRFLGGLSIAETAEELSISTGTVETDWAMARAWLSRELRRA